MMLRRGDDAFTQVVLKVVMCVLMCVLMCQVLLQVRCEVLFRTCFRAALAAGFEGPGQVNAASDVSIAKSMVRSPRRKCAPDARPSCEKCDAGPSQPFQPTLRRRVKAMSEGAFDHGLLRCPTRSTAARTLKA